MRPRWPRPMGAIRFNRRVARTLGDVSRSNISSGKIGVKRELYEGVDVERKTLQSFTFNRKSLGSVLVASEFNDGSSGVVFVEGFPVVPSMPGLAMLVLLCTALTAVVFAVRVERA